VCTINEDEELSSLSLFAATCHIGMSSDESANYVRCNGDMNILTIFSASKCLCTHCVGKKFNGSYDWAVLPNRL